LSLDPPCEFDGSAVIKSVSEETVADSSGMTSRSVRRRFGTGRSDPRISTIPRTATDPIGDSDHQQKLLEWRLLLKGPCKVQVHSASALGEILNELSSQAWSKSSAANKLHPLCSRRQAR